MTFWMPFILVLEITTLVVILIILAKLDELRRDVGFPPHKYAGSAHERISNLSDGHHSRLAELERHLMPSRGQTLADRLLDVERAERKRVMDRERMAAKRRGLKRSRASRGVSRSKAL